MENGRVNIGGRKAVVLHGCSYCNKSFESLQALGGHQTAHRREIEEMRKEHDDAIKAGNKRMGHLHAPSSSSSSSSSLMRRVIRTPITHDQVPADHGKGQQAQDQQQHASRDHEDNPLNLELTLGLPTGNIDLTLRL